MVFVMDLVKGDGWISSSLGWNNCEILNKRDRRVRSNYYLITPISMKLFLAKIIFNLSRITISFLNKKNSLYNKNHCIHVRENNGWNARLLSK